jgi:acetoacetyl-CoA synthetase
VLVDGDDVVGFVSTILSERTIRGETVRLCNTSSWIVKHEYRTHSLALHAKVVADKSVTVTNLRDPAGAQSSWRSWASR